MAGAVFHQISEGVMSKYLKMRVEDARNENSILVPEVKNGNVLAADYVLNQLDVNTNGGWNGRYADGNPIWGSAANDTKTVTLAEQKMPSHVMPDVIGMGACDAVYMLESRGLKVNIVGRGKVKSQSISYGSSINKGMTCTLILN
jgi:cell division protein FtsI (penicillin-binding protein 3)